MVNLDSHRIGMEDHKISSYAVGKFVGLFLEKKNGTWIRELSAGHLPRVCVALPNRLGLRRNTEELWGNLPSHKLHSF